MTRVPEPLLPPIVIDDFRPRTPSGAFPAKVVEGEPVRVSADIYTDGHDELRAVARIHLATGPGSATWAEHPMTAVGNDRWEAVVTFDRAGRHEVVVEAWVDLEATWARDARIMLDAGQEPPPRRSDHVAPTGRHSTGGPHPVWVDRPRAVAGAWYELFPRSEGGFAGTAERLVEVAAMGFDVVYLPPVHPIGRTQRKGPDNTLAAGPGDPGSPWAIGGPEGGHTAVHPDLGTLDDFDRLVARARQLGLEIALDYALQCSPDHPWVSEHPAWFHHRADGSIAHAANPPKQYQDIYPLDFWPSDEAERRGLWQACREIVEFWVSHGVRIFLVDNPHTKPMAFWAWLIPAVQSLHPDVLFLSEAFTRPKVMVKLAEVGFSQSYTYFTWRRTKAELTSYVTELTSEPLVDHFRPAFWPNTPDILAGPLRGGNLAAFRLRLLLAATLVPTYGIYSGFELGENQPRSEHDEEYAHSEKYEIKARDWSAADSLAPFITEVNRARRAHPALRSLRNIAFCDSANDLVLAYARWSDDLADVVLVVVNLDPDGVQEDTVWLDLERLGLPARTPFVAYDELRGETYSWVGAAQYVRLDPAVGPGHLLHLRPVR